MTEGSLVEHSPAEEKMMLSGGKMHAQQQSVSLLSAAMTSRDSSAKISAMMPVAHGSLNFAYGKILAYYARIMLDMHNTYCACFNARLICGGLAIATATSQLINPLQSVRMPFGTVAYSLVLYMYTTDTYNFYFYREKKDQRICLCHVCSNLTPYGTNSPCEKDLISYAHI